MTVSKTVFAQFTKVQSIHPGFYKLEMKDKNKIKSLSQNWQLIPNFSSRICQSLYDVKRKAQSERSAP
jgi:hypothetical protein